MRNKKPKKRVKMAKLTAAKLDALALSVVISVVKRERRKLSLLRTQIRTETGVYVRKLAAYNKKFRKLHFDEDARKKLGKEVKAYNKKFDSKLQILNKKADRINMMIDLAEKASVKKTLEKNLNTNLFKGGLADGIPDNKFNKKSIQQGMKVEMEHTNNPLIAKEIAKDHLMESKTYYRDLKKIEHNSERGKK